MKVMKQMLLATTLATISGGAFASESAQTAPQPPCDAGFTTIVTGDYSKAPQQTCLPTDPKQAVTMKLGQTFTLSLPANPSTGASWALRSMPNSLMLLSVDYHNSPQCKKGMIGCGGFRSYTFEVVAAGVGELKLNYGRSWEKDSWESKNIAISVQP
ncbi:MAG: protease inhibitor I42 family protein [Photobacterium aquimaris]|nr:protease inhibitor I42 family protein [Photobacterium aquimaris]